MGRKLLSIDGATQKTGWCIIDEDTFHIDKYGVIEKLSKDEPIMRNRVIYMIDEVKKILEENHIDDIVQEEVPPAINNASTVLALGILSGGILGLAHSHNLYVNYITVPYWHSKLDIKKSKGDLKEQSIKWVNDKYKLGLKYFSPSSSKNEDNQADAIAIGCVWLGNYNEKQKFGRR